MSRQVDVESTGQGKVGDYLGVGGVGPGVRVRCSDFLAVRGGYGYREGETRQGASLGWSYAPMEDMNINKGRTIAASLRPVIAKNLNSWNMLNLDDDVKRRETHEDGVGNPVNYHESTGKVIIRLNAQRLNSRPTM